MHFDITTVLLAISVLLFLLALIAAARPMSFLLFGKRVKGRVRSEHLFTSGGTRMRFYRVSFGLSTGQPGELRSSASARWLARPGVGAEVDVLLRERAEGPKACIATWPEMWLGPTVLLFFCMTSAAFAAFTMSG
ncbi:hypothetical protein [Rhizobacter sp. LjRoot28]|uniref:hypothetical protein n=1 Tax=Rhizobacter sp. LjRoot28 TaxID=3342309 RepID=UPI003ECD2DA9